MKYAKSAAENAHFVRRSGDFGRIATQALPVRMPEKSITEA
jgi:hypothetical protein